MLRFSLVLTLAVLSAACAHQVVPAPSAVAPAGQLYLALEGFGEGARTLALSPEGELVGSVDGVLLGAGDEVFSPVTTRSHDETGPSCADVDASPAGPGSRDTLSLVLKSERSELPVIAPAVVDGAVDITQEASIVGVAGPFVVLRESVYEFSCGAHGQTGISTRVVDLSQGAVLGFDELGLSVSTAEREEAARLLEEGDTDDALEPVNPAALEPTMLVPSYGGGALSFALQMTTDACYACSDQRWSSYSRSSEVSVEAPALMRDLPELPPGVRAYLSAHPSITGISWASRAAVEAALAPR